MRRFLYLACISILFLTACDIHEWPSESQEHVPFLLHLDFNSEMSLHKEVTYTRGKGSTEDSYDIRYMVNVYRTDGMRDENRAADTSFIFTKEDLTELDHTLPLNLREGTYTFRVWTDFVRKGSQNDNFYDTRDFSEIILADRHNHTGSTDFRDAFRGYSSATVADPKRYTGTIKNEIDNSATVPMMRPMGKFKFISTDTDAFRNMVVQMMQEKAKLISKASDVDLSDYEIVFRYNHFMPCSFNMFTDKPADSWEGMSFKSRMYKETEQETTLGYDYIFVNGSETTLSVSVEVYDKDGKLISSTKPIDVPIVRNKLTVVKGDFLTSKATGGITINPGYDGDDYNIEIF